MLRAVFLAILLASMPLSGAFAANSGQAGGKQGSDDPGPLFAKAYDLEYFKDNNVREVDAMFAKAAQEGDPFAIMEHALLSVRIAQGKEAKQKAKEEACPKIQPVVNKWRDSQTNSALAVYYIADAAFLGICGKADRKEAARLLELAANAGNARAQVAFGTWLIYKKEPTQGIKWYEKAAAQKFPEAFYRLGLCYLNGTGVEKNTKIGMEYIDKALACKNPRTDHMIATGFLDGNRGFPKDLKKAEGILESLVKRGFYFAEDDLKDLHNELKAK